VMTLVAGRFLAGARVPSQAEFTRLLGVPMHALQTVLDALEQRELIVPSTDDPPLYLPARDPSLISVTQVLDAVRAAGEERYFSPDALPAPHPVDAVLERMRQAVQASVGDMTLRELAAQAADRSIADSAGPEDQRA